MNEQQEMHDRIKAAMRLSRESAMAVGHHVVYANQAPDAEELRLLDELEAVSEFTCAAIRHYVRKRRRSAANGPDRYSS